MLAGGGGSSGPRMAQWSGTASIKGSSEATRMALLTISLIGIQFTWGVEMTYCTPYLLRLGLTKDKVSLVWIAGPLSGLIMQPIVGILADRSTSSWGRRRPFMLIGTLIVCLSLFVLGWTKEVVSVLLGDRQGATIALAVLAIYGIDFAINAVQASTRSLISDTLPLAKQQMGSAWASRMVAVGSLIGYGFGAMDLERIFGKSIGDTQFKQLVVIAGVILIATVGATCWAVEERVLLKVGRDEADEEGEGGIMDMFTQIWATALNLPDRISAICWVQFWCWIGWFPFLFYSTTWLGEVYLRFNAPADVREHPDSVAQIGRVGSTALIVFSIVTFAASVVMPWFIDTPSEDTAFTPRPPESIAWLVTEVEKHRPTLEAAWSYSHIIFAGSMFAAPFVTSLRAATTIVALCGIPWALACWAPFTFIGMEISRVGATSPSKPTHLKARDSMDLDEKKDEVLVSVEEVTTPGGNSDLSGVYLGILNVYTTLPQFIGTFISWIVFSILEPGKSPELAKEAHPDEHHSTDGPNAIAVCLFIGALAAIVAGYKTEKYRRLIGEL